MTCGLGNTPEHPGEGAHLAHPRSSICPRRLSFLSSEEGGDRNITKSCWRPCRCSGEKHELPLSKHVPGCPSPRPPAPVAFHSFRNQHPHSLLGRPALPASPNPAHTFPCSENPGASLQPSADGLGHVQSPIYKAFWWDWEDGPSPAPSPLALHPMPCWWEAQGLLRDLVPCK